MVLQPYALSLLGSQQSQGPFHQGYFNIPASYLSLHAVINHRVTVMGVVWYFSLMSETASTQRSQGASHQGWSSTSASGPALFAVIITATVSAVNGLVTLWLVYNDGRDGPVFEAVIIEIPKKVTKQFETDCYCQRNLCMLDQ